MKRALIIGGNGQIGRSIASNLIKSGWIVTSASRTIPAQFERTQSVEFIKLDRKSPEAIKNAVQQPIDLLVDCISFDKEDALQLLGVSAQVGKICVISSISVYKDENGRTLDEASSFGFPHFPIPITVEHPTVAPGQSTYSTRKIEMEQTLLNSGADVNVLRPGAIYGPYSKHAREWFFVKRLLDGRKAIPLAYNAASQFHPTSVENIAQAVKAAFSGKLSPVTNVVDPSVPNVKEIGQAIMKSLGIEADIIGLDTNSYPPNCGRSPWSIPAPMIVQPCEEIGFFGNYEEEVKSTVNYLRDEVDLIDWHKSLPILAGYPFDMFDYEEEDEILSNF